MEPTDPNNMIRDSRPTDRSALEHLTKAIGFEDVEITEILLSFDVHHQAPHDNDVRWFIDDDDGLQGVAYIEPERMTDGTYNLLFIGIYPREQRQGRGTKLIAHIESQVALNGGRLLIVETMGTDDFAPVRGWYKRLGFFEEARIRDFYADGYDKIVFRKLLKN